VACTHTTDCPLFPKLNESLAAWRTHYCDTEREWMSCARYKRSMLGEPVPIALLPNGKIVGMLVESAARSTAGTADPVAALPTAIKPSLWRRLFGKES